MKSLSPKTIDLYQSFFRRERLTHQQQSTYLKYGAPATVLAAMVLTSGFFYYNTWQMSKQYKPLGVYLSSNETQAVYNKAVELKATEEQLLKTYKNLVQANDLLASYPKLTKEVFEVVYSNRPDTMTLGEMNYTGATGLLTIAATATRITDPADYVEKLKKAACFDKVEYAGYGSSDEQAKQTGVTSNYATEYSFTVSCYLTAPAEVTP